MLYPQSPPGNVDNFPDQITLPDDGKPLKASDVNVAFEALTDRTGYLRTHAVLGVYSFIADAEGVSYQYSFTGTSYSSPTGSFGTSTNLTVEVPNTKPGDLLLLDASFGLQLGNGGNGSVRAVAIDNALGGGSTAAPIPGARFVLNIPATHLPCTLVGAWTVAAAGTTRVQLQGRVQAAPSTITVEGVVSLRVTHVRLP